MSWEKYTLLGMVVAYWLLVVYSLAQGHIEGYGFAAWFCAFVVSMAYIIKKLSKIIG